VRAPSSFDAITRRTFASSSLRSSACAGRPAVVEETTSRPRACGRHRRDRRRRRRGRAECRVREVRAGRARSAQISEAAPPPAARKVSAAETDDESRARRSVDASCRSSCLAPCRDARRRDHARRASRAGCPAREQRPASSASADTRSHKATAGLEPAHEIAPSRDADSLGSAASSRPLPRERVGRGGRKQEAEI